MKTLFVVPLFFILQPLGAAKPCDATDAAPAAAPGATAPTPTAPHTEGDAPAKKNSSAPASRPPAPKREPITRPVHLFME